MNSRIMDPSSFSTAYNLTQVNYGQNYENYYGSRFTLFFFHYSQFCYVNGCDKNYGLSRDPRNFETW